MRHRSSGASLSVFLIFMTLTLLAAQDALAWSNGGYSSDPANPDYGTHDWIADAALQIQTQDVAFLKTTYHATFLLGTEAPDNPDYIGDSGNHHVYYYSDGSLQDDACADRASSIYSSAAGYLKEKDYELASFEIGVMAHYISDVGVFGHTMGSATDWGSESHHSDYENYVNSLVSALAHPTSLGLEKKDARSATLGLAEEITFGDDVQSGIRSNVWMDDNYDWTEHAFYSSARASLNRSVAMVAAVINHLLIESGQSTQPQPVQPQPQPQQPQPVQPQPIRPQSDQSGLVIALGGIAIGGTTLTMAFYLRMTRRKG